MSDHCIVFDCDQRHAESIGGTQPFDYQGFGLIAMFLTGKSPCRHIGDGGVIALLLFAYKHRA